MIRWGTYLLFDHAQRPEHLNRQLARLKHAVNADTVAGAYNESGGHALCWAQPLSDYTACSVLNMMRRADRTLLTDTLPTSVPDPIRPEVAEHWRPTTPRSAKLYNKG